MAISFNKKAAFIAALVLMSTPARADVMAHNQCAYDVMLFYRSQGSGLASVPLASGAAPYLGLPNPWVGGVMWGSPNGNTNMGQCTQLEFNINSSGRDYYHISLVNAYNIPAMINPTYLANGDVRSGLECGTIHCTIHLPLTSNICPPGSDNVIAGPDGACLNTDGPGLLDTPNTDSPELVDTPNIDLFRNACPEAYVQNNNNTNVVYACNTGSNYAAIFCP